MRFIRSSGFFAAILAAGSAFGQIPTFSIVNHGLDTFSNAGKGIFDPQVAGLTGIAFGNGLFVVLGASGNDTALRWATSPDGTTWTARSQPLGGDLKTFSQSRVHFLNGKFLFFAEHTGTGNGGYAYSSADGLTWTRSNVITTGRMIIVEFDASPTLTVAASTNGAQYASADLVTWTRNPVVPGASGFDHLDLAYGAGRFFSSINGFGGTTYTSLDGTTWTSLPQANNIGGSRVSPGNGMVLLTVGNTRFRTTDGTTFSPITPTVPAGFVAPGGDPWFAGGRFIAAATNLSTLTQSYLASADGQTWTTFATLPTAPPAPAGQVRSFLPNDIAFGNGKYVIAGNDAQQSLAASSLSALILTLDAPAAPTPPQITTQPAAQGVVAGGTATFTVAASGSGNSYQWQKDGVNISGATNATLTVPNVSSASLGAYRVIVTNSVGSITSSAVTLELVTASNIGRLINMSIRTAAGTGDSTLIVGVTLGGPGASGTKPVLVRGVGPTLSSFGVTGALADPVMTIFQGTTQVGSNDDWGGGAELKGAFPQLGAFALSADNSRDAAIFSPATAIGGYSIQITGKNNTTGIALAEVYDATSTFTATTPRLTNVSARTQVGTGDNILIAGFVIGGSSSVKVLIRAVGPTLASFGVGGTLADPKLDLFASGTATAIASNDNWAAANAADFTSVGAFALNAGSRDAALVTTLNPGSYTAQVSGVGNTTGVALVEVYELP